MCLNTTDNRKHHFMHNVRQHRNIQLMYINTTINWKNNVSINYTSCKMFGLSHITIKCTDVSTLLYAGLYMRSGICPTLQPSWSSLIIGMKSVFMSKMSCDSFSCNYVWDEECFDVKDELWYPFCNYIWASNMSSIMNKLFCLMVPIWKMTTTFYMPFYWFFVK